MNELSYKIIKERKYTTADLIARQTYSEILKLSLFMEIYINFAVSNKTKQKIMRV